MKKNLFYSVIITTAVFIASQTLTAQNTAPYWSQVGNLNASPFARLGTLDATPLNLSTNNTTRMCISPQGNIGIGTVAPAQQLHVAGNTYLAGYLGVGTAQPSYELHVAGNTYVSGNLGIGMFVPSYKFAVDGMGSTLAIAGFSNYLGVYGSGNSFGVYGAGTTHGVYGSGYYGVYGQSTDGYGGFFNSINGTALYASTSRSDRNYAAVFQGNIYTVGTFNSSDKNLKKNVEEFGNAMSIINKLKPKFYEFRQDGKYAALHLPQGKHYGLIAQEVETVLPDLVREEPLLLMKETQPLKPLTADGKAALTPQSMEQRTGSPAAETINIKAVNYTELIPILVKALQEQNERIEQQQQQISELKQLVSQLTNSQTTSTSLSSGVLLQNVPNPVKGNTSISYNLPEGAGGAQLLVTDASGRTIKTLQLTRSGVINLDVSFLSSGVYTYSLVIDNKIIQTRKMTIKR